MSYGTLSSRSTLIALGALKGKYRALYITNIKERVRHVSVVRKVRWRMKDMPRTKVLLPNYGTYQNYFVCRGVGKLFV